MTILPAPARAAILYVGGSGPGNYTTIQAAAGAAQTGDTIFVFGGTYMEGPFDLGFGVSLVGEDRATTIIETSNPIRMAGWSNISSVTIQGFAVQRVLWLWFADHASIEDTAIYATMYGIFINSTVGVTLRNNAMHGAGVYIVGTYGYQLPWWNTHTIDPSNTVNGKPVVYWKDRVGGTVPPGAGEVILANVTDVTVDGQTMDSGTVGIQAGFSTGVAITGNSVSQQAAEGIGMYYSSGSRVQRNTVNSSNPAVYLWYAPGSEITDNRLDRNSVGVHVVASSNNTVANNTVPNGLGAGVVFDTYSDDNVAANNTVANATFGIYSSFASDRTTVVNNTISGCQDGILLTGTGDRIVGNTVNGSRYTGIEESGTDDVIAGNTVYSNIEAGIRLYSTLRNTVAGNNVSKSYQGILVGASAQYSLVVNNTVFSNTFGIVVGALSRGDTVTRNNVSGNSIAGIEVVMSTGTVVTENTVARNAFGPFGTAGVYIDRSSGIRVHHNNFLANAVQGRDDAGGNFWDDGYPSGGNYWSDYTGIDNCSGPSQNVCPNPDGIGDTAYSLVGAVDRYPLMGRSTSAPTPPSEPWNVRAAAGDRSVTLTWSAPVDDGGSAITNYRIYGGTAPGTEGFLLELGNVLTYTDSGISNGVTYYFQISAKNSAGEGPRSAEVSGTPRTVPGPPTALTATPATTQITLTWSAPSDDGGSPVTGYRLYRGTVSGGEAFLTPVPNVLTYTDTGLSAGVTYYYQVAAVNAAGEGGRSAEAYATPPSPGNQPPSCSVTTPAPADTVSGTYPITGTSADIDGSVVRVEIKIDAGSWTPATGTNPWRYDWDTRSVPGGSHTIHARSYDGSSYSEEVNVTVTVDNGAPPPRSVLAEGWFWALIALVVLLTAILTFVLWRQRRKRPGQE